MKSISAIMTCLGESGEPETLDVLTHCELIDATTLALPPQASLAPAQCKSIHISDLWSESAIIDILNWFDTTNTGYLLWILPGAPVLHSRGIQRLLSCAEDAKPAIVYGDYVELKQDGSVEQHPLIDYQAGSIRDDFDFGSVLLFSRACLAGLAREIKTDGKNLQFGGFYDLRLRLSERGAVIRLPEPVYALPQRDERLSGQKVFDYVDPGNRAYQIEMEQVATSHLQRIGAFIVPPKENLVEDDGDYPVRASVVIPVKNRIKTIADALNSALSQVTNFDFNVIVVDNHSTDGSTEILSEVSRRDKRLIHIIPQRNDLGIGGCWNEAIYSKQCGKIVVQLDSDDIYSGTDVLQRIVAEFDKKPYALVIGSYTTVDFELKPLHPGLVDHREWTEANGQNNALRIAGLGAPRAFHAPTLRAVGFPNVSYGEDYAAVVQLCRKYPLGRIYDSLYWCRRWEENSDSALSLQVSNRYHAYKDSIRTIEIAARQKKSNA